MVALVKDNKGRELSDRTVSWSSSDASVVSVAPSGTARAIITAKNGGWVTISASVEGLTATFQIQTFPAPAPSSARSQAFIYSADGGMMAIAALAGGGREAVVAATRR